jgi:hopene-associated glycosyltransferase HpnB
MIASLALAPLSLIVWVYLVFAHGRFWISGPQLPAASAASGASGASRASAASSPSTIPAPSAAAAPALPAVDIIVPARDEAATIRPVIASLLGQDYAGRFRVWLVDDGSIDGTAALAGSARQLTTLRAAEKPPGWSGKLWALHEGVAASSAPLLLFTDADIVHDPRHLASLVVRLLEPGTRMVSEMVHLHCVSFAERALVPAFVYFFQMLYPFARVNDPRSRVAAAAGGTVLIRREALDAIGGIGAIRGALIDDVALAAAVKPGGAIYLGHSGLAASIRPYPHVGDIWRMISRTAFTQLRHSLSLLVLTLLGLTLVWWVPVWQMFAGQGWLRTAGCAAFVLAACSYQPTLTRYGRNRLWALVLPLIALFYMAATVGSAMNHWRGRGARWKDRAYGAGAPGR